MLGPGIPAPRSVLFPLQHVPSQAEQSLMGLPDEEQVGTYGENPDNTAEICAGLSLGSQPRLAFWNPGGELVTWKTMFPLHGPPLGLLVH